MARNHTVLWATDGSESSLAAVSMLENLVLPVTNTLHALAVAPRPMLSGARPDPVYFRPQTPSERHAAMDEAFDIAEASLARLTSSAPNMKATAAFGHPIQEILRMADRVKADLIVLGAKGHSDLKMMILGSVAQGVLEYSRRPVLLVRPGAETVRTAIIGIDGSKQALRALQFFESLAIPKDAYLVLSRAMQLVRPGDGNRNAFASAAEAINQRSTREAERDLAAARDVLQTPDISVENEILIGKPGEQLLYSATQHRADLIVVGSKPPSRVRKYLVGGTAEMVARESHTSVLVVR